MNDIIEAISCEREIIQLKLLNVPKHPKMIAKIFSILKDEEIVSKNKTAEDLINGIKEIEVPAHGVAKVVLTVKINKIKCHQIKKA